MKKTQQIFAAIISLIILTFFVSTAQALVCNGYYRIDDLDTSDDIAALSGCTEIVGDLIITRTALTSLSGLENLTVVLGDLNIYENTALTSLSGLENLTVVEGDLQIFGNFSLTSLKGLDNLTRVGSYLSIQANPLTSLSGLENLTVVDGYLDICDNDALTSLSGLENLTVVGLALLLLSNDALTSLSGLENLTSVGGLENPTSVGGDLYIEGNDALTNLCSLYNLNLAGDELFIDYNTVLSMATAYALETQLRINGFTGTAVINDNSGTGLVTCDIDNDTITDAADNCPNTCNPEQLDADGDGDGDVCDGTPGCGAVVCGVPQPECEEPCGGCGG